MTIYELLERNKKARKPFDEGEEYAFFLKNRSLLDKMPKFSFLYDHAEINDFDVMRANIIIYSLLNKKAIETEILSLAGYVKEEKIPHLRFVSTIRERTLDLPYFSYMKAKIFIPVFSLALNMVYAKEPEKLLIHPYDSLLVDFQESFVDPFDTYGTALYDSYFTRLVKIDTNGREAAFFHYDTNTVYIVNDEGRLDGKIVLFDRWIRRPNYSHMLERLRPVIAAYFSDSRTQFLTGLLEQGFMSDNLYNFIKKEDQSE